MNFQFEVNVTEKDYLDYNLFWQFKSPYGKKQILTYRVVFALLFGVLILLTLLKGDFSTDSIIESIFYFFFLILVEIFFKRLTTSIFKSTIKSLKKKGKMAYSPTATAQFHENTFIEITPETRNEVNYSLVELVSVIGNQTIYIHVNNMMAYLLPSSSFTSQEQFDTFVEFLKTKCERVKYY